MNKQELIAHAKQKIEEHPYLKEEIEELVSLAIGEIEDGESEENECELAVADIKSTIANYASRPIIKKKPFPDAEWLRGRVDYIAETFGVSPDSEIGAHQVVMIIEYAQKLEEQIGFLRRKIAEMEKGASINYE